MAREQYIVGIDLGTGTVRAVQGKFDAQTGELSVVGAADAPCLGMRRGTIVDIEETVSSISQVLEKLERMTGVAVASANVSIGGSHITSLSSHGVIAVSRPDGEITEADVIRCIDASQAISIPSNREVLHVFPKTFTLDGQTGIRDPLGMSGIRLEVDTIIVQAGLPFVKNLSKAILQAGVEIEDMVLAPLAASQGVLSKRQQELGVCVVDLGAGTTGLAVYEEGDLLHTAVLPIGCQHITNDIAIGLRSSIETAEKVKLQYGHADPKMVSKVEEIELKRIDPSEDQTAGRAYVVEIIEARLEEIFSLVTAELKKIGRDGKLPAGVVLTGGGSLLPGIVDFAKKELRLPAALGVPHGVSTVIDRVQDPAFATVVGLLMWAQKYGAHSGPSKGLKNLMSNPALGKLKNWFKSFLP
jgi:cell division protein FtsA